MASSESIIGVGLLVVFVFGWNNSSFLIGSGEGSGSLTLREALLVSTAGLLLGVALEGSQMLKSLGGSITQTVPGPSVVLVTLVVALAMTAGLSLAKLPVSFSMATVGAFAGASFGSGIPLVVPRLDQMIAFWFFSPLLAAVLAFLIYGAVVRWASRLSLVALDGASRYGVILTTLVIAFVLGANNIGLVYGVVLNGGRPSELVALGFVGVAILGMLSLGRGGISRSVGDRLLVLSPLGVISTFLSSAILIWVGTQFAIPISISQCLLGGILGAAFSRQSSVVNSGLAAENIASWLAVPTCAFLLGLLLVRF